MAGSPNIVAHIPQLRRFARALTGSRENGDAYALAAVEAFVASEKGSRRGADANDDARVALYRLVFEIWATTTVNLPAGRGSGDLPPGARRNLEAISLRPRVAFLLHSLEGLPISDVARVMKMCPDEAAELIALANDEIRDQIATDVLIIEDEPLIALDLREVVEKLGHRVMAVARTRAEAIAAAARKRPGLILADIQLADDSSGLDAVNDILRSLPAPVIFVTAYPERFLLGRPPEPAYLLAKPFSVDALRAIVSQALFFDRRARAPIG